MKRIKTKVPANAQAQQGGRSVGIASLNERTTDGAHRSFEQSRESGSEERPLPGPPETTEACRAPAAFCGRWRRRRWLWELWPKPKFLVCRDETRLIYCRRSGDPKEEKLTSLAGDQNANAESLELRFGKRVLETIIGAVEHGLPEHFHGIGRSSL